MNKQTARHGFTITELVIVIVVIAILAAVLIPTFVSLINKANQSADIQAARQMDTALQAESAKAKPAGLEDVIDILSAAGFDAEGSLKPITKDHKFYWYKTFNAIVLANHEEATSVVVYPAKNEELCNAFSTDLQETGDAQVLFDLELGFRQYVQIEVESSDGVLAALSKGQSVTLTEDVEIPSNIYIPSGENATINLNGKTLTAGVKEDKGDETRHHYAVDNHGTLTLTNGTFTARGVENHGKLIIEDDVVVNAIDRNGGAAVYNYANSEIVINGGKFNVVGVAFTELKGPAAVINNGTMTINGGTFTSTAAKGPYAILNYGDLTINNATVVSSRGCVANSAGTTTINGGTFTTTWEGHSAYALYVGSGTMNLKNATINAEKATYTVCTAKGATFNNSSSLNFEKIANADGSAYFKLK